MHRQTARLVQYHGPSAAEVLGVTRADPIPRSVDVYPQSIHDLSLRNKVYYIDIGFLWIRHHRSTHVDRRVSRSRVHKGPRTETKLYLSVSLKLKNSSSWRLLDNPGRQNDFQGPFATSTCTNASRDSWNLANSGSPSGYQLRLHGV